MASYAELPELPANAALLTYLRGQASPPDGPGDYTLGPWQLHTHPGLMSLLRSLAADLPVTEAYGVPLLASAGVAAVVALGMDWLAVRIVVRRVPGNWPLSLTLMLLHSPVIRGLGRHVVRR